MLLRAHRYSVALVFAAAIFGSLAFFAGDTRNASAQSPRLSATLTPASAQMTTGATASFNVMGVYTDANGQTTNVVPATISWLPNGATVASYNKTTVVIRAGSTARTGNLGVDITYAGLSAHADATLRIVAPPAPATPQPTPVPATPAPVPTATPAPQPTPTPAMATPAPLSAADNARFEAMTSIFRPATATNAAPRVSLPAMGCLEKNLGAARFAEVSSGQSQPTAADRKAAAFCFTADVVPAILAPVAVADLNDLSHAGDEVSITKLNKVTNTAENGQKTEGFIVSGKGTPDANIYLYIFSDPIIHRAQVNSSGDWTFALTSAIPAGKHEIFAVAETSAATFVRTLGFPVEIAAASPAAKPDQAAQQLSLNQLIFAGAAALMLLLALVSFIVVMRRRRRPQGISEVPAVKPGSTVMPSASELMAAAPVAPTAPVSVESIVNTPIPKSTTGSTYLPGGTVPQGYPTDSESAAGPAKPPQS